jgi:sigma-B regulation protein RsbU (phosphoserine phosphatase)
MGIFEKITRNSKVTKSLIKKMIESEKNNSRKLRLLLQITQAINHNFSRDQLLKIYKGILTNQLNIKRAALFIVGKGGYQLEIIEGLKEEELFEIDIDSYLKGLDNTDEIKKISNSDSDFFEYLIPIFHKEQALAFLFIGSNLPAGDIDEEYEWIDVADLEFIETLSNVVFVALENKKLAKEAIYKETLKKEIELAAEMQLMLFPTDVPLPNNIDVDAFYMAHQEVGGDYYDYFLLNDQEIVICIADVSGKGVSAALLMSNFQANVRALFPYIHDMEELAKKLNAKVEESAKGEKFITVFIARYNINNRILTYVNCGHNAPILFSNEEFHTLNAGSIGLGMMGELPFVKSEDVFMPPASILVCYTDGLTEAAGVNGKFFGTQKIYEIIKSNHFLNSEDINQLIFKELKLHSENKEYSDDIALLTLKFK